MSPEGATPVTDPDALERAEDKFRLVVEGAPNAIVMVDRNGRIVLANPQAEKLFGYPTGELLGHPVETLLPSRYRPVHVPERDGFLARSETRPMGAGRDLLGLRKDGSEVPVEIGLNPVRSGGEVFVLASIIDITARKAAEDGLRASLHEKDVLLQEIHHRVKNNLQLISSLLKLQANQIRDAGERAILQDSIGRVHAIALVHEQLYRQKDISRLDYGPFLRELVSSIARAFLGRREKIQMEVRAADCALEVAYAVPVGVVVNELVSNSLKHAFPDGRGGKLCVELNNPSPGIYELLVCDDGKGLPEAFSIERSTSMGLRLVSLLVRQLNGKLEWDNAPGARFRIVFGTSS